MLHERRRCRQLSTYVIDIGWRLFGGCTANQAMSTVFQTDRRTQGISRPTQNPSPRWKRLKTMADLEQLRQFEKTRTEWRTLHRTMEAV